MQRRQLKVFAPRVGWGRPTLEPLVGVVALRQDAKLKTASRYDCVNRKTLASRSIL